MDKTLLRDVEALVMTNWPARDLVDAIALLSAQDPVQFAKPIERFIGQLAEHCMVSKEIARQYVVDSDFGRRAIEKELLCYLTNVTLLWPLTGTPGSSGPRNTWR